MTAIKVVAALEKAHSELSPEMRGAWIQLLDAHASALRDATHWKAEYEKCLRVSIMQGDVIANHVIAMQSAVIERYAGSGAHEAMDWIANTIAGPGFMPDLDAAIALPGAKDDGPAQAWFNAKTAEHEAFRTANPGPAALDDNTKGAAE